MAESVYQSDPDAAPDSEFLPGELRHLVAGNRGRLLDLRRTPVLVTQVSPGTGFFEVEIGAFEDAGALWLVPVEDVTSYQFAAGGRTAGRAMVDELRAAAARPQAPPPSHSASQIELCLVIRRVARYASDIS